MGKGGWGRGQRGGKGVSWVKVATVDWEEWPAWSNGIHASTGFPARGNENTPLSQTERAAVEKRQHLNFLPFHLCTLSKLLFFSRHLTCLCIPENGTVWGKIHFKTNKNDEFGSSSKNKSPPWRTEVWPQSNFWLAWKMWVCVMISVRPAG